MASKLDLKLDHLMIAAQSHQAAAKAYEALGFKVTPLRQNGPMGGAEGDDGGSQLIMFAGRRNDYLNYLEISTTFKPKALPLMNRILQQDGVAMMVNFCNNISQIKEHWAGEGYELHYFEGEFPSSGSLGGGKFEILIPDPESVPIQINAVFSSNREGYNAPEWQDHPNGAIALTEVRCVSNSAEIGSVAKFIEASHDIGKVDETGGGFRFDLGQIQVKLDTDETVKSPKIGGFQILVTSLAGCRELLSRNGVSFQEYDDRVFVKTMGSHIEFVEKAECP